MGVCKIKEMKLHCLQFVILQILLGGSLCLSLPLVTKMGDEIPEEISRELSELKVDIESSLATLRNELSTFLKTLEESITNVEEKLKDAENGTKKQLSEMLLKSLLQLKEQIGGYLLGIISKITEDISALDDNKPEAKFAAALFVLKELHDIDEYLKLQWPQLEKALMDLNGKLKAANAKTHEALSDQLASVLMQAKSKTENVLKKLKERVEQKLAELKAKLEKLTTTPTVVLTATGSGAPKSNEPDSEESESDRAVTMGVSMETEDPDSDGSESVGAGLKTRPLATIWLTSMLLVASLYRF